MNLYYIAFSNLKRRKAKMFFVMMGLIIGVSSVVALTSIVQAMRMELGDRLDEFGANVLIVPSSEGVKLDYTGAHVSEIAFDVATLSEDDLPRIQQIPDANSINIISPKVIGAISSGGQKLLLVGVDTRKEFGLKPWFSLQEQVGVEPSQTPGSLSLLEMPEDSVIMGYGAARALGKSVGEEIELNGENFTVFGVLAEIGAEEDGLIYASLPKVQSMLGKEGQFSMIEISAYCNACPIEEIVAQLSEELPGGRVTALRQAALVREETIDRFASIGFVLSGVVVIIAALIVLSTLLSSVNERAREIGIFRAIGFRSSHIVEIIIAEVAVISILGGLAGYVIGILIARFAGSFLAQMEVTVGWNTSLILPSILISLAVAMLSSIYPAIKASRLDPVESLRLI